MHRTWWSTIQQRKEEKEKQQLYDPGRMVKQNNEHSGNSIMIINCVYYRLQTIDYRQR